MLSRRLGELLSPSQCVGVDAALLELRSLNKNGAHSRDCLAVDVIGDRTHPFGAPTDALPIAKIVAVAVAYHPRHPIF